MHLDIITPEGNCWSGETSGVRIPGTKGSFEVLHNHAPIISTLTPGVIQVRQESGETLVFRISGGVIEVSHNRLALLTETAEPA
ncbi:MAG: ATP synthase F1 subunit epsilon [Bacteroidales bacterium]|nr:ATP synthase F1 subunit epsilon [Bacteroidales bacterium]